MKEETGKRRKKEKKYSRILQTFLRYRKPQSQILVNHTLSDPFTLTRSIRQGCNLSPLLYVLSIEPLLKYVRQKITGIPGQKKQKVAAYADDTTFFVKTKLNMKYGKS